MPGQPIQTGFWIDHSKGVVLGGTLTYESQWGAQLISAATVLVQLTGSAVWIIVAFWLHQRNASEDLKDEFDAQKSVILRNSGAFTTVTSLLGLGHTWHGHAPAAWKRTLATIIFPLVIYLGFLVSGVMVGQIAINPSNSQALLQPETCGYVQPTADDTLGNSIGYILNNVSQTANSYARDCYGSNGQEQVQCTAYSKPNVTYTTISNASCPIGNGNCALGDDSASTFTAMLDSHEDLGINAKSEDRLQYGYSATCAPLSRELIDSFSFRLNDSDVTAFGQNFSVWAYNFGTVFGKIPFQYSAVTAALGTAKYDLWPWYSFYPHQERSYTPWAPFNSTRGDNLMLLIFPNAVVYADKSSDPVFATESTKNSDGYYDAAHLVSSIFCVETYRICKSSTSECSPWTNFYDFIANASTAIGLTPSQNATYVRFAELASNANLFRATLIGSPLQASQKLISGIASAQLPDNQWFIESESWFRAVLAKAQYLAQAYTAIPKELLAVPNIELMSPDTAEAQNQCYQQRIQIPGGYQSYNVFALVFILIISLICVTAAVLLTQCHHKLPHRGPGQKNYVKLLSHFADGQLQLHRMALEAAGVGGWKNCVPSNELGGGGDPYVEVASKRVPPPAAVIQQHKKDSFDEGMVKSDTHTVLYDKTPLQSPIEQAGQNPGEKDDVRASLIK